MKKHVLKNKEIYRIGDKVLKSVRLPDEEIDRIVAAPHLVDRLRAAMESGQAVTDQAGTSKGWPLRYTLRRQNAWAAIAVVLVLTAAIGWVVFEKQNYIADELAGVVQPPNVPQITAGVIDIPEIEVRTDEVRKVREPRRSETARSARTRSQVKTVRQVKEIEMGEFQALTYAGEREEPGEGGRIVRVELSPAALFAMGVDIAVENESGKVKADLLIGADGVMKGVRVEKRN
jgi:hypothetical protein